MKTSHAAPAPIVDAEKAVEPVSLPPRMQAETDRDVLHACLSRLSRLLGYTDDAMPGHVSDIDVSGVSEKYAGIANFARVARLR